MVLSRARSGDTQLFATQMYYVPKYQQLLHICIVPIYLCTNNYM